MTDKQYQPRGNKWFLTLLIIFLALPLVALGGLHYFDVISMPPDLLEKVRVGILLLTFLALASFFVSSFKKK